MNFLQTLTAQASMRVATAAKVNGTLEVAGRANFIHARFSPTDPNTEFECRASVILPNVDDSIVVMLENPAVPNSWRMVFWLRDASDINASAPVRGS